MLNGRYDFLSPVETSQRPLFNALGTLPANKRHVIFESGHAVIAVQPMVKEILDWLDTYIGPVKISLWRACVVNHSIRCSRPRRRG